MKPLMDLGIVRVLKAVCPQGGRAVWFRDGTSALWFAGAIVLRCELALQAA